MHETSVTQPEPQAPAAVCSSATPGLACYPRRPGSTSPVTARKLGEALGTPLWGFRKPPGATESGKARGCPPADAKPPADLPWDA